MCMSGDDIRNEIKIQAAQLVLNDVSDVEALNILAELLLSYESRYGDVHWIDKLIPVMVDQNRSINPNKPEAKPNDTTETRQNTGDG